MSSNLSCKDLRFGIVVSGCLRYRIKPAELPMTGREATLAFVGASFDVVEREFPPETSDLEARSFPGVSD